MNPGRNYPDENRDRLKTTNDMWTYPEHLGPGPLKAHIPAPSAKAEDSPSD